MTYSKKALQAYQSVNVNSGVEGASPHQLISMLLDGAQVALTRAKGLIERKDIEGRSQQLNKVADILHGLLGSLDQEKGGEVAANLESLYDYMIRRVMEANRDNDIEAIDEVARLLGEIKSGWEAMPEEYKG
ncbi:flagellar export chaperone FliS [Motiliproteus sp. MSK22-1]|uniref:flagellar export chaperone FliS n=1 Tax=Motiliproteus sp. MSK22-1 TaxID=1897630 RepID=UPI0009770DF6|nr:flagellar export chaperone FliS [Motiliproteus sp. MSK22-1]OMH30015.1 flagellar export chaperone FliS [Motiliproteus sp. MSK22-1]